MKNQGWKEAGELYMQCRDYKKAIECYCGNNYLEGLIDVCRQLDKDDIQNLQVIAQHFRKNKHLSYAKEAYLKLADMKNLIGLYIEMEKWEDALLLGK